MPYYLINNPEFVKISFHKPGCAFPQMKSPHHQQIFVCVECFDGLKDIENTRMDKDGDNNQPPVGVNHQGLFLDPVAKISIPILHILCVGR